MDFKNGKIVRKITDEEVVFYEEHGWVKLDGFIAPEVAAKLLEAAKELKATALSSPDTQEPEESDYGVVHVQENQKWKVIWTEHRSGALTFQGSLLQVDPFLSFRSNKSFGRAAQRFMNRAALTSEEVGVRYFLDQVWCKESIGPGSGNETGFHQDGVLGDRVGGLNVWIALDEITPEQGAMRFLDRSHRAGLLGPRGITDYPKVMENYSLSPLLDYRPGDATVHNALTFHGSPENTTTKPRWPYICTLVPADNVLTEPADGDLQSIERYPLLYP